MKGKSAIPSGSLNGTSWVLETLNGQPPLSRSLTMNFENSRLFGSAGCNRYFGFYSEDAAGKLRFERVGTTLKWCLPNEIMVQERLFKEMLKATVRFSITADGKLTLNDAADAALAVFNPQSQELAGTSWQATSIEGSSLVFGSTITVIFGADGKVGGSAGCNSYSGGYTASAADKTIDVDQITSTRMMCHEPAGVMEQENAFIVALESAATYRIERGFLDMRKADGSSAVTFYRD